jgi:hypothetical protein
MPLTRSQADKILEGTPLIPVLHASISRVKQVIADCLEADIPVVGGMPPNCGTG